MSRGSIRKDNQKNPTSYSSSLGIKSGKRLTHFLSYLILIAGLGIMILPFVFMVSTSVKTLEGATQFPIKWIPATLNWRNFIEVFEIIPMARFMLNTLVVASVVTVGSLTLSSLAAYAFARLEFKGRNQLFFLYLATLMIPGQVTMIPVFIIMSRINMLDTYSALIFPSLFTAFGVFMLRQFFMAIPKDLEEAARIDGCNHFRIYWHIVLPISKPAFVTLGIFIFLREWSEFLWPLVVIESAHMQTIQVGLRSFMGEFGTDWHLLMAGALIAELPVIILYIFCQKYVIEGIATTGIKG